MKILLLILLALGFTFQVHAGELIDLSLADGSRIKGEVMSVTAAEVTLKTDFGVLRIDHAKLTTESKAKLLAGSKPDVEALMRRIAELEARVSQLTQENETLRRRTAVIPAVVPPARVNSFTPSQVRSAVSSGLQYSRSSTGKRHNSNCRYFTANTPCEPSYGVACKICGG